MSTITNHRPPAGGIDRHNTLDELDYGVMWVLNDLVLCTVIDCGKDPTTGVIELVLTAVG